MKARRWAEAGLRAAALAALAARGWSAPSPAYRNPSAPLDARVEDLLRRMTLDEKITLLGGGGDGFETRPIGRLGVPPLRMSDGPAGVGSAPGTAFPAGIALAASFDPGLVREVGAALGRETRAADLDVLLGPCVNIARVPQGGRVFESFGEDPFLAARIAQAYVQGLQSQGALASVKHFALNNQETGRNDIDVRADERTMREIYLPAFEAAVRAGAWTVMAAYNRVNGPFATESRFLLERVLKDEWGFRGPVMSDWGATHDAGLAADGGLDLEMPTNDHFGPALRALVAAGRVSESAIDEKARRVLRALVVSGRLDAPPAPRPPRGEIRGARSREVAARAARAGVVLLKNDRDALPLGGRRPRTVAVIGPNAAVARVGGGGSSQVVAPGAGSLLDGLRARAPEGMAIRYEIGARGPADFAALDPGWLSPPSGPGRGLRAEFFAGTELAGPPRLTRVDRGVDFDWGWLPPDPRLPADHYSVRWSGRLTPARGGALRFAVRSDDGCRLWIGGKRIIDDWHNHAAETRTGTIDLEAGRSYDLRLEYYQSGGAAMVRLGWFPPPGDEFARAVALARGADAAVVAVGLSDQLEAEGYDRAGLALPAGQDELIEAVAAVNPRTIVVVNSGGPVLMERWIDTVPAVVQAWYLGQEGGTALADVLLGRADPGGRLPLTFPRREEDSPARGHFPGDGRRVDYAEGVFVGYRGYDARGVEPRFPFGHGLSYARLRVSDLRVAARAAAAAAPLVEAEATVTNVSDRPGEDVVQLYIGEPGAPLPRPPRELKGFAKVSLRPGQSRRVVFRLERRAFAHFDPRRGWTADPGRYAISVGRSSRDLPLTQEVLLK